MLIDAFIIPLLGYTFGYGYSYGNGVRFFRLGKKTYRGECRYNDVVHESCSPKIQPWLRMHIRNG